MQLLVLIAALVAASQAQEAATTTSRVPVTHTIGVGKGGHTFEPDVTLAEVGDTIKFEFSPKNHSVVRAEYGYPCVPYEMVAGVNKPGFFSGFKPVDAVLSDPPTYEVRVNDTDPIFFYCSAPGSCISYQMVGVVNPNANTSLARQKQLAGQSTFMLQPGDEWPSEDSSSTTTTSSSPTTSATSAAQTSTSAASTGSSHGGLTPGAIAGIAIGAAAVALGAAIALYMCGRQSRRRDMLAQNGQMGQPMMNQQMAGGMPHTDTGFSKHTSTVTAYGVPPVYGSPSPQPQYQPQPFSPQSQRFSGIDTSSRGSPPPSQSAVPAYAPPGHPHMSMDAGQYQAQYLAGNQPPVHEMPSADGRASASPTAVSSEKNGLSERYT